MAGGPMLRFRLGNFSVLCLFFGLSSGQPVGIQSHSGEDGSSYSRLPDGATAFSSPFLSSKLHETSSPYNGAAASLFTGQAGYAVGLASIQMRGRVSWGVEMKYAGKTRDAFRDDNRTSPTSWLGLGWSLGAPYIARNPKGTMALRDDLWYADLGPLGEGVLARGASGTWYMSGNPYLTVTPAAATGGAFAGQIESWTIKAVDGSLWVFGDLNGSESASERIIYQSNGPVRVSPHSIGNASVTPYIYRWDIRYIADAENKNRIYFDYQKTSVNLFSSGKSYTQQSYLKNIRTLDRLGGEAERIDFKLKDKGSDEYVAPPAEIPNLLQEPLETKYLDSIKVYHGGTESNRYGFTYTFTGSGKYRKRFLDEIRPASRINPASPTFVSSPIWKFTYATTQNGQLVSVQKPNGGKTEFEYGAAALGASGQQPSYNDANNRLKNDAGALVAFPNDLNWQNTSACAERFCVLAVKDGNKVNGNLYLEISPTRGNYVDAAIYRKTHTGSATIASNWKWTASGDYVIAYDANAAKAFVHEWDGVNWSLKLTADFGATSGSSTPLSIHATPNYFVATQTSSTLSKVWVYVKRDNAWTKLNQSSPCDIDNPNSYGETVKSTTGCLEFNSTVQVAASSNLFVVAHDATDILYAYALNKDGNNFTNVSGAFLSFDATIHNATYPNNWSQNIASIKPGTDYLLVQSTGSSGQRLDVMHFDGLNARRVASTGWEAGVAADLTSATSENYFVAINQATGFVNLWRKTGGTTGFTFTRTQPKSGVPARSTARITLRAFPEAFAFEFGRLNEDINSQPVPLVDAANDYSSFFYQIDPASTNAILDRSDNLKYTVSSGTTRLFGVFLTTDNFLGGVTLRNTGNQAAICKAGETCTPFFATMKVKRGETGTPFAHTARAIAGLNGPSANKHVVFSVARTGMLSWFDGTAQAVKYRHFGFDGDDFAGAPENLYVVKKVIERSGVDPAGNIGGPDAMQTLAYDEANGEFNYHLQLPQFPKCTQKQVDVDGVDNGRSEIYYNMDVLTGKWYGRTLRLNGTVKETRVYNKAGNQIALSQSAYRPFGNLTVPADWPTTIPLVRLASTYSQDIRPNGSKMSRSTIYSNYNNINGQPQFTKSYEDNTWRINQTVFNGIGSPLQTFTYAVPFATYPGAGPDLEAVPVSAPYFPANAIVSAKMEYDPSNPYYVLKRHAWRDTGSNVSNAEMQSGTEPAFNLANNWIPITETRRRNVDLQVEEIRLEKSSIASGESYTSIFYEGKKQLAVGTVTNSELPNCALLLGENGELPGFAAPDLSGRWAGSGLTYSTSIMHSGRYGMKVVDNLGISIKLNLQNVRRDGFGYIVSAWIYRPAGSTAPGGLRVKRYNAAGTEMSSHVGIYVPQDPEDAGASNEGRWERWEVKLTYASLIAGGLFNGAADHLIVRIGMNGVTGNTANTIVVDDVVCMPDNAKYAMTTYDYRGFATSRTDTRHRPVFLEYDYQGTVLGTRDERGRIFQQGSANLIGEN